MFHKSRGFISHFYLGKSPTETFGNMEKKSVPLFAPLLLWWLKTISEWSSTSSVQGEGPRWGMLPLRRGYRSTYQNELKKGQLMMWLPNSNSVWSKRRRTMKWLAHKSYQLLLSWSADRWTFWMFVLHFTVGGEALYLEKWRKKTTIGW